MEERVIRRPRDFTGSKRVVIVVTKTETKEEQSVRQKLDLDTKSRSLMNRGKYANSGPISLWRWGFQALWLELRILRGQDERRSHQSGVSTKEVVLARPVEASGVPAPAGQELKGLQAHRKQTPGQNISLHFGTMQSGITVSKELQDAFNHLVSNPSQRGIIATISSEALILQHVLPSKSTDFFADLPALTPLLSLTAASYIVLRRYQDAPDGYVAITYIPDTAPVRQKMLFASTRLTLVRELGTERFRESLFVTEMKELEKQGWEKHDAHGAMSAPLTEEEENLKGIKEAEAEAKGGTEGRRLETGGKLSIALSTEAREALGMFRVGEGGSLLQLNINVKDETIELVGSSSTDADGLASAISDTEPRYSFFRYTHHVEGSEQSPIVFIYTCPSGSKIKERMVYASTKQGFLAAMSSDMGVEIAKRLELSSPSEITASTLEDEFRPKQEQKQGFSKPKRPGKR
ncbi:MAG: Twinfilin-1 [Alectoria sarmentosa]|nr:MAG: Twinfilin-1 [Alectoria sarmentosa]